MYTISESGSTECGVKKKNVLKIIITSKYVCVCICICMCIYAHAHILTLIIIIELQHNYNSNWHWAMQPPKLHKGPVKESF